MPRLCVIVLPCGGRTLSRRPRLPRGISCGRTWHCYCYNPKTMSLPALSAFSRRDLTLLHVCLTLVSLPLVCKCSPCSARTKLMLPWKKRSGERSTRWISMPRGAGHGRTCTRSGYRETRDTGRLRHRSGYILSKGRLKPPASRKGQHLYKESQPGICTMRVTFTVGFGETTRLINIINQFSPQACTKWNSLK